MPIVNIVDRRKRPYRFNKVNAIVEAAWHDNSCADSDQVAHSKVPGEDGPTYEQCEHVPLTSAIAWANGFSPPVTLYLYDEDGGIYAVPADQAPARSL